MLVINSLHLHNRYQQHESPEVAIETSQPCRTRPYRHGMPVVPSRCRIQPGQIVMATCISRPQLQKSCTHPAPQEAAYLPCTTTIQLLQPLHNQKQHHNPAPHFAASQVPFCSQLCTLHLRLCHIQKYHVMHAHSYASCMHAGQLIEVSLPNL